MSEGIIIFLLVTGPLFWMLGGTYAKWIRRFAWPAVVAGCAMTAGVGWLSAIMVAGAMVVVNSLPYGDRTPWPLKVAVFILLMAPALIISLKAVWIVAVCGLLTTLAFWATRRWAWFTHKAVEGLCGFLQACVIVFAILLRG